MTTLTSTTTITVGDAPTVTASTPLLITAPLVAPSGSGRLIHPTIGTYDYALTPTQWANMVGDAVIPPIWSAQMTLASDVNTLWAGNIKDVVVVEEWDADGGLSMPLSQLAVLLAMWQNPPDPDVGYVQWYPNYINSNGYNVIIEAIKVENTGGGGSSGDGVYLDTFARTVGMVAGAVSMSLRLVSKL